jgi:hypothetical protein
MPDESVPLRAKTLGHAKRPYVVSAERKSKEFIGDASSDVSNKRGGLVTGIGIERERWAG